MKACLVRKSLNTWVNYRQFAIEIAKRGKAFGIEPWSLNGVVYVTAAPIQSHNAERYSRWRKFQEMLVRTERVSLKLGRLEGPPGDVHEKGVDILVALELLRGAYRDEYDVAILVAGDGDYADIVTEVRAVGKTVLNAFFSEQKSYELAKASNGFIDLNHVNWSSIELRRDRR